MTDTKTTTEEVPRLRLASHIDMSKADPNCDRCGGSGIVGTKDVDLGPPEGVKPVPVICRCVSRAGGVQSDMFDRILSETQKRLDDGTFAEALASDVRGLPVERRGRAILALAAQVERTDLDPSVRAEVARALQIIGSDA